MAHRLSCDGVNYNSDNSEWQLIHTNDEVVLETKLISAVNWNFSLTEFNRKNVGIISPIKFFSSKIHGCNRYHPSSLIY